VTVDPSLAELSDTLFSIAVALYSVAVVAFSAQLAFGRRPARQLVPAGGGGAGGSAGDTAPAAPSRTDRWGLIGLAVTALGALVHAGVLVTRGMAADRLPWGNMYEFATAVVLVGVVVYLVLAVRIPAVRDIGAFVLAPVVLALVATGLFLYTETGPLVAALRSSWLAVHVSTAILGFGIFFVSGIASVLYLLRRAGRLDRLPGADAMDRLAYRVAIVAFPLFTFAVITGAVWAEAAWGRFWGWDPKETVAFVSWVVYAAYLHARATAGWRTERAAWINIAGFATVLFNLFFINMVVAGLHSYAGLG